MESIGSIVANLHNANIIHGDLTTSNFLLQPKSESIEFADSDELSDALIIVKIIKNPCLIYCIDFGLSYMSSLIEDKAVDIYVLKRALISTHPNSDELVF